MRGIDNDQCAACVGAKPQNAASIGWNLRQAFDRGSRQLVINQGGEIVTAGVTCKHVFQLKSGLAIRQRPLRDGGRAILDLYFPGDLIELDSLFFGPPLDTVLALTRVSYRALDHAALNRLMQEPRSLCSSCGTWLRRNNALT